MTNNRRSFIKKAGMGLASMSIASKVGAQTPEKSKVEKSEDGYATGSIAKATREIEKVKIKVKAPLLVPYNSSSKPEEKGTGYNFYRSEAFAHNPFTINCGGISGSPVIMDANGKFVGFMTTFGLERSVFEFDGVDTLTAYVPEGQELYIDESGKGDEAWKEYNTKMFKRLNFKPYKTVPKFWEDVEYCTWVEQKMQSKVRRGHFKLLTHNFIKDYLNKVIAYGYPKGKMTIWKPARSHRAYLYFDSGKEMKGSIKWLSYLWQ